MSGKAFGSFAALLKTLECKELAARPALTFYRGRTKAGELTYGELVDRSARLANALELEVGLARGDRLLVLAPNSVEIPVLLLAAFRLGVVVVPLNPAASSEDWGYIATHAGARGLVATRELGERFKAAHAGLEFALEIERVAAFAIQGGSTAKSTAEIGDDLAVVLYTSGTTGHPKGVALSQRSLLHNAWSMAVNFGLERATQFAVLPLYHAHALGFGLMTALSTGGHLVFTDKLDPFAWSDIIRAERVRFTSVVPNLLPMLLAARVHRDRLPSLEAVLVSSAPLSAEYAREFQVKTALTLRQGWGLSEYTNFACCLEAGEPLFQAEGTSVGGALAGTEVIVAGSDGQALGEGEVGELWVRGPSLMLGYYRDPEATTAAVRGGWLRTGDQGYYTMQGAKPMFSVTGRIKEIIIRSGEKYSPLAIERLLAEKLPDLASSLVVVGFVHHTHGEEIGAYLEAADELPDAFRERLRHAIELLSIEIRPKVLLHSSKPIPRTHTGKIQRRKLAGLFAGHEQARGALKILPA